MNKVLKMILITIGSVVALVLIAGFLFLTLSPQFGAKPDVDRAERITKSPNYRDGKFHNIEATEVSKKIKLSTFFKFFTKGDKVPPRPLPVVKLDPDIFFVDTDASATRLTWFGHSAVLLELDGKIIFIDPMLGDVPAPHPLLGQKRFTEGLPLEIEQLPELDAVILSHDHYDHLDHGTVIKLKDKVKRFYAPLGVAAHLVSWGVSEEKITELDWWESAEFEGVLLTATPSRHFSDRGMFDRFNTLWCAWVIKGTDANIFYGGDSGYDSTFQKIGAKYGPFDITMLECGQYNEQWPLIHMMPEQVVQAQQELKGKLLFPIHWGAFKLSLHSWDEPMERLIKAADAKQVKVTTPKIGEPIVLGKSVPTSEWWKAVEAK